MNCKVLVLYIPRKIMLSPYAKKCIVFHHIFRTKCWYWINTSTLSFSAYIQSAGIELIPALCGLIIHTLVISQFFCSFFHFWHSWKFEPYKNDFKVLRTVFKTKIVMCWYWSNTSTLQVLISLLRFSL